MFDLLKKSENYYSLSRSLQKYYNEIITYLKKTFKINNNIKLYINSWTYIGICLVLGTFTLVHIYYNRIGTKKIFVKNNLHISHINIIIHKIYPYKCYFFLFNLFLCTISFCVYIMKE